MNYSTKPHSVRVDFFKPSGKWYTTEAVLFPWWSAEDGSIHEVVEAALEKHLREEAGWLRLEGMIAVCIDPHHEHAHPIMMLVGKLGHVARGLAADLEE